MYANSVETYGTYMLGTFVIPLSSIFPENLDKIQDFINWTNLDISCFLFLSSHGVLQFQASMMFTETLKLLHLLLNTSLIELLITSNPPRTGSMIPMDQ